MNDDERPAALEEIDNLQVGPAPVGDLLHAAHAGRRRRRAILGSVAAVTVLLVGGGFATTQLLGDTADGNDVLAADGNTTASASLRVAVRLRTPAEDVGLGAARWEPGEEVVRYALSGAYSSSCPPEGTATVEDGVVSLALTTAQHDDGPCTADARQMVATVDGLTAPPTELLVTEDGEEVTVAVAVTEPDTLACASGPTSSAFPYVLGPESPADAKDWPRTPEDAAQGIVDEQNRSGFGARVLGDAEPAARRGIRYDVLESGGLVGQITVEERGFGAYAATLIEQCSAPTSGGPAPVAVDLPTNGSRPGDGSRLALIAGVLSVDDDDCVYLARGGNDGRDARVYATWPDGFTATLDADRNLTLFDSSGDPVAYGGERLAMSGGYGPNPGTERCLPRSETWIANIGSEVAGQGP